MAPLPPARVNPSPPFTHVGVNYAGPLKIKMSFGRGHKSGKGYIVVFVCFCTKAVHLEAVTSYDSSNFLNAFKRFVSRRGLCSHVYSDCGTNFVGADKQLKHMFSQDSDQTKQISDDLAKWVSNGTSTRLLHHTSADFGGCRKIVKVSPKTSYWGCFFVV